MHHSYSLRVAEEKHYILYEQDFPLSFLPSLADGAEDNLLALVLFTHCCWSFVLNILLDHFLSRDTLLCGCTAVLTLPPQHLLKAEMPLIFERGGSYPTCEVVHSLSAQLLQMSLHPTPSPQASDIVP